MNVQSEAECRVHSYLSGIRGLASPHTAKKIKNFSQTHSGEYYSVTSLQELYLAETLAVSKPIQA